jgi:hypothetical protein
MPLIGLISPRFPAERDYIGNNGRSYPSLYVLAPGTTGRMFLPDEVGLRVDKQTLEAGIYHGKVIDYAISHLVYIPEDHSIVVVMND